MRRIIGCPFCDARLPTPEGHEGEPLLVACTQCLNALMLPSTDDGETGLRIEGMQRVSELAPEGSVMAGIFGMLSQVISELPVMPEIPQRIVSLIHDPITSMEDLSVVINDDAAISLKVLRMANSAFYSSAHEITELRIACARLGMKAIANIAHATSNSNFYRSGSPEFRDLMKQLWFHGLATAHCADEVASLVPGIDPTLPFVAGLVHDTGKLVLLDTLTTKYKGNVGRLKDSPELLLKVLNRFQHIVGLHVVQYWKMAPAVVFATFFNDQIQRAPQGSPQALVHVIALSSAIADTCGYQIGTGLPPEWDGHPSLDVLQISEAAIQEIIDRLPLELESVVGVLGVF